MAFVPREYIRPPKPLPAVPILLAKDRRFENHCGTTPTLPTKRNPMPKPKATPCERNRCHIRYAKDAPRSPAVSSTIPTDSVACVPNLRVHIVAIGATKRAREIDRPPTKAYSREDAPGKVLLDR
jgi:hypothetical protein